MGRPAEWRELRRVDLKGFDRQAQNVVLMAMERGGVGRISNKGHAILRSPSGATMSVSKNTGQGNRGRQNMEANFRACFGALPVIVKARDENEGSLALAPDPHPLVPPEGKGMLECPVPVCEAEFVTEGARYTHVHKEHYPCAEPGCQKVFDTPNKASGHYNVVHRRAQLAKEDAACPVAGCDWAGKRTGLPGHSKKHPKRVYQAAKAKVLGVPPKKKPARKQSPAKAPAPQQEPTVAELAARIEALEVTVGRLREALK